MNGQRTALLDQLPQGHALDELHDQEVGRSGLVSIVNDDDVGVLELGGGLGLTMEALDGLGLVRQFIADDFEGDKAFDDLVLGLVDRPHAADAKEIQDEIAWVIGQVGGNGAGSTDHGEVLPGVGRQWRGATDGRACFTAADDQVVLR